MKIPKNLVSRKLTSFSWLLRETFTKNKYYRELNSRLREVIREDTQENPQIISKDSYVLSSGDYYIRLFMKAENTIYCASGYDPKNKPVRFFGVDFYHQDIKDSEKDSLEKLEDKAHWLGI